MPPTPVEWLNGPRRRLSGGWCSWVKNYRTWGNDWALQLRRLSSGAHATRSLARVARDLGKGIVSLRQFGTAGAFKVRPQTVNRWRKNRRERGRHGLGFGSFPYILSSINCRLVLLIWMFGCAWIQRADGSFASSPRLFAPLVSRILVQHRRIWSGISNGLDLFDDRGGAVKPARDRPRHAASVVVPPEFVRGPWIRAPAGSR